MNFKYKIFNKNADVDTKTTVAKSKIPNASDFAKKTYSTSRIAKVKTEIPNPGDFGETCLVKVILVLR